MNAGALSDRVAFHRREETPDGYGNTVAGFAADPFLRVYGRLQPERGQEAFAAGRMETGGRATLTIRYSAAAAAVTAADKAVINGVDFAVRGIIDPMRKRQFLELTLERGAAP